MKKIEIGLWIFTILLIVLAGYEYNESQNTITGFNWTPIYEPVSLEEVGEFNYEFVADKDIKYYIYLDVERSRKFDKLKCLIGAEFKQHKCPPEDLLLDMEWQVNSSGQTIASGSTKENKEDHSYWMQTVGKGLGAFEATTGNTYQVSLKLNQPIKEIMPLHPKIKIAMHPREFKEAQFEASMTGLITVSLVAFAVLLLAAFYFFKEYKSRQTKPS